MSLSIQEEKESYSFGGSYRVSTVFLSRTVYTKRTNQQPQSGSGALLVAKEKRIQSCTGSRASGYCARVGGEGSGGRGGELENHPNSEMPPAVLQPVEARAPRRGGCSCRLPKLFLWRAARCRAGRAVCLHKLSCDSKVSGVHCIHEGCRECVDSITAHPFRKTKPHVQPSSQ